MKARDVIAKSLADFHGTTPDGMWSWAKRIHEDIEAAGLCIVPMEPTDGMLEAGCNRWTPSGPIYRAMIAAYREG